MCIHIEILSPCLPSGLNLLCFVLLAYLSSLEGSSSTRVTFGPSEGTD